jgi:hypothetical protein
MTFLTSKILGTVKKRGMGCYLRHALKTLSKVKPATAQSSFFDGLLKAGQKALGNAANKGTELTRNFKVAFESNQDTFCSAMSAYVLGQPVKLYSSQHTTDDGRLIPVNHLPQHQDLNALARVIVLMSDPEVQTQWHTIANEDRSRQGVDDRNASRTATNEKLETELLDKYFNNSSYKAPHSVDLSPYEQVKLDPTAAPTPPKSLHWFREQRRWAKVVMGCIQTRFVRKTGRGEMGHDGADADTVFFTYCRGDLLVMFLWLHWGRGNNVPAHCTAVLDEESRVDIGSGKGGSNHITTSPSTPHTSPRHPPLLTRHHVTTSPRHPPLLIRRHVTDAFAGTSSPKKVVEKGGSRIDQQLETAFLKLNAITEPLLNLLSPTKPASLNSEMSPEAAAAVTASECKAKLMASIAGRVQSLETMKQSVSGDLKNKVQEHIDALVKEVLQTCPCV